MLSVSYFTPYPFFLTTVNFLPLIALDNDLAILGRTTGAAEGF